METARFGENIQIWRRRNNLTQTEMAKLTGIGVKSIRKIEKGEMPARINASTLNRICDVFKISADVLLFSCLEDLVEE